MHAIRKNNKTNRKSGSHSRRSTIAGQAMVEAAITVPFLLLMLFGIMYFGRLYWVNQEVLMAAQEGARLAARTPNLTNTDVRDQVRGFTTDGGNINQTSVIYSCLAASNLLSNGHTGNLPQGAQIAILPWDPDVSPNPQPLPAGTVAVEIVYPFNFVNGNIGNNGVLVIGSGLAPAALPNYKINQKAVAAQEIYQN